MTALKYNLVSLGDTHNLTLVHGGEMYVASDQHPNWDKIVKAVLGGDDTVVSLFDVAKSVAERFKRLTDRATVAHGALYFDGDEMHNALATEVVRFLDEGVDDWKPLVNFLEKVAQNPQPDSREQLYGFLERHEFTITDDGDIIGYKSVRSDGADGFLSISSGTAIVNGEVKSGQIPQKVGDIVEMPRSEVAFDPTRSCSTGLHVANWDYASTWTTHDAVLAIAVNPRDVVSVPNDSGFAKVRVCRYTVLEVLTHKLEAAVYPTYVEDDEDENDDDRCWYCDEYTDECGCNDDDRYFDDEDDEDDLDDEEVSCENCGEDGHDEWDCDEDNFDQGVDGHIAPTPVGLQQKHFNHVHVTDVAPYSKMTPWTTPENKITAF